jgi:hypothetical protein
MGEGSLLFRGFLGHPVAEGKVGKEPFSLGVLLAGIL